MLQLETIDDTYSFHSYDEKSVKLIKPDSNIHSNQAIEDALLEISSTTLIYKNHIKNNNMPDTFSDFNQESIEKLLECSADIYLIGTGTKLNFPEKEILKYIAENKLPIDFMDTGAACRTYNILAAEYRNVATIIFFE